MNIFINILVPIICLIIGYLFGSFPSAVFLGKYKYHQDPREFGSKNSGATNAGRLWGKKACFTVILLDAIKTILPFLLAYFILSSITYKDQNLIIDAKSYWILAKNNEKITGFVINWPVYYMVSLGCFFGHCFPIFANFKGGKGVTVFLVTIAISSWVLFVICAILFLIILKISKAVSLSSLITTSTVTLLSLCLFIICKYSSLAPEGCLLFANGKAFIINYSLSIILLIMCVACFIRHRKNIKRLKEGNELTIKWMK